MKTKEHKPEEIVKILRQVETSLAEGTDLEQSCRKANISKPTYYRWKRQYGSTNMDEVKRMKELEKENARLRKLVADLSLDKDILQEALKGKW
jgi:transposase-like protein